MAGFCLRGRSLWNTQRRITLPPSARPSGPRLHLEFLPIQNTARWETQAAAVPSSRHLQGRKPQRQRVLLLLQIFSPIIPCALRALSFSANPILGSLPLPPAASSYGPSLLFPSDVIRSLCIKMIFFHQLK